MHFKVDLMTVLGKILFEVFGPEGAQDVPKLKFFKWYQKLMNGIIVVFCMKQQ